MKSVPSSSPPGGVRLWLIGVLALVVALAVAIPVVANLGGTTFNAGDGNLNLNGGSETDWINAPNRVNQPDLPTGTGDNSFGQGTKEDTAVPTIVDGSIPPNKSDLTRFYAA